MCIPAAGSPDLSPRITCRYADIQEARHASWSRDGDKNEGALGLCNECLHHAGTNMAV